VPSSGTIYVVFTKSSIELKSYLQAGWRQQRAQPSKSDLPFSLNATCELFSPYRIKESTTLTR
jgi:hypothetical protein